MAQALLDYTSPLGSESLPTISSNDEMFWQVPHATALSDGLWLSWQLATTQVQSLVEWVKTVFIPTTDPV